MVASTVPDNAAGCKRRLLVVQPSVPVVSGTFERTEEE